MELSKEDLEELIRQSVVSANSKKLLKVRLLDKDDDDEIAADEIIDSVREWVDNNFNDSNSKLTKQTLPLLTTIISSTFSKDMGDGSVAALLINQPRIRDAILKQSLYAYYIVKFLQTNNIKISPEEREITDEQIEQIVRVQNVRAALAHADLFGMDKNSFIQAIIGNNVGTRHTLKMFGFTDTEIDEALSDEKFEGSVSSEN